MPDADCAQLPRFRFNQVAQLRVPREALPAGALVIVLAQDALPPVAFYVRDTRTGFYAWVEERDLDLLLL